MRRQKPRLGELLEERGWITREQLLRALRNQKVVGGKLGTCLLEVEALPEETLLEALSIQQSAPSASSDDLRGVPDVVTRLVPAKVARRLGAVPFRASGTQAKVAVLDASDLATLDELSFVTGRRVHLHVTSEVRLAEALERYYDEPCPHRLAKLVDRLNRSRFLWRAEGGRSAEGGERPPPHQPGGPPTVAGPADFLPKFESGSELELPPVDLPGPAAPPPPSGGVRDAAPPPERSIAAATTAPAPLGAADEEETTGELALAPPPLGFEAAEARLQSPADRDDVGRTLLEFAAGRGRRAMLFKMVRDGVAGWLAGAEVDADRFAAFHVPQSSASVFRSLLEGAPLHRGPLSQLAADSHLQALRGGAAPAATDVLLLPLRLRDRTVGVLYLEPDGEIFPPEAIGELQRLTAKATIALELCILRSKLARA